MRAESTDRKARFGDCHPGTADRRVDSDPITPLSMSASAPGVFDRAISSPERDERCVLAGREA